jgi:hypothetical protein
MIVHSEPSSPVGREPSRKGRTLAPILAALSVAFLLYAVLWPAAPVMTLDTPSYMRLAHDIRGLHLTELSQRTPGYPLLLLLTGSADHLTRALYYASLAAQFGAVALLAWVLGKAGVRRAPVAAFAVAAALPPFVAPAAYSDTEALCQFALAAAFAGLVAWAYGAGPKAFAAFAVSAVFAALVRPTYEILAPALFLCALAAWRCGGLPGISLRRVSIHFSAALAFAAAVLGGYAYLNYRAFGYFDLSSMGAIAMSHKTASFVEYLPPEYGEFRDIMVRHRDRLMAEPFSDHTGQDFFYRASPDLMRLYGGDRTRVVKEVKAASIRLILQKPFSYLHDSVSSIATYWMPVEYSVLGDSAASRFGSAAVQWGALALFFLQAVTMLGAALLALFARFLKTTPPRLDDSVRRALAAYGIGMAIVVYTLIVSCFAGIGQARYRVPTDLLILGMTALGFTLTGRLCRAWFGAAGQI